LPVILTEDAPKYKELVIRVDNWLRLIITSSKIHTAYFQFPVPVLVARGVFCVGSRISIARQ
jgi:hypothetical protein